MNSLEFIKKAKKGEIDIVKNTKKTIDECKEINKKFNYFLSFNDKAIEESKSVKKGKLYGLPISIKDNIVVKDIESKAGSKILKGYNPVFDATIVKKIKAGGGIILGKTAMDVFGFGSFNVNTGYKAPLNPFDKTRCTGGSSGGGSGILQKLEMPSISITESTGGSIASPASYCGVYGMTPTYGRISRNGLIDYANSLDKIGVTAKDIEEIALMMEVIAGYDEEDSTSKNISVPKYTKKKEKKFKICVIEESLGTGVQENVKSNLLNSLMDIKFEYVSMPLNFNYSVQTYYLISMSEASTNLAKLCGMRYGKYDKLEGNFNEYFSKVRSSNFIKEAKRRIILGTFARMSGFRDAYYLKALKVRTKIIEEYKKLFKKYDLVLTPSMPNIAPKFSEIDKLTPLDHYMTDIMTAGPNLAGFPHLSIPNGISENMPTGLLAVADHFDEHKLIDFARWLKSR